MKRLTVVLAAAIAAVSLTACQPQTTILIDEFGTVIDGSTDVRIDVQLNGTRTEERNIELCEVEWGGMWIAEKYVCEGVDW